MASIHVISTVCYEHDALELLEFGHDCAELYELVPDYCVEREVIAKRMQERLARLLSIKAGNPTGGGRGSKSSRVSRP